MGNPHQFLCARCQCLGLVHAHLFLSILIAGSATEFVAPIFNVPAETAKASLKRLAFWDQLLRITQLSPMILWLLRISDAEFIKNLNYYLSKTEHALSQFHHALQGKRPNWEPELTHLNVNELIAWREQCLGDLRLHMLNPVDLYHASPKNMAGK